MDLPFLEDISSALSNINMPPAPECQCIPALKAIPWNERPHRIPIDCWTEEDEYLKYHTFYVVGWRGDEDCGANNSGPFAIYRSYEKAMMRAQKEAMEANGRGQVFPATNGFMPSSSERGACEVTRLVIEKEEEDVGDGDQEDPSGTGEDS